MSEEINISENNKKYFILFIGVVAIIFFIGSVFYIGAIYGCSSGGGVLAKNINGMRCIDINTTDLCRDYRGVIIEKPISKFNTTFNISDYYGS